MIYPNCLNTKNLTLPEAPADNTQISKNSGSGPATQE